MMKLPKKLIQMAGFMVRNLGLPRLFSLLPDGRPSYSGKLVFMCGREGIRYLNASLVSIYLSWDTLPDICIVSDGTPLEKFRKELIRWPGKIELWTWEQCASYYRDKGNESLYLFARDNVWGKKFLSILYFAEQFPTLYSDTDLLWFAPPGPWPDTSKPFLWMSREAEGACYTPGLLQSLGEEKCGDAIPYNAGLILASGDFSGFSKWGDLSQALGGQFRTDNRAEQTAFAILANHFGKEDNWVVSQVLLKIDDAYSLGDTRAYFPDKLARHYVNTKQTAFWRDFLYLCLRKRKKSIPAYRQPS